MHIIIIIGYQRVDLSKEHNVIQFVILLQLSGWSRFELANCVLERCETCEEVAIVQLENFFPSCNSFQFGKSLIEQSHQAFNIDCSMSNSVNHEADALNGLIMTDCESDDLDAETIHDLSSAKAQALIIKKKKAMRRHARYLKSKHIAERNFLARQVSHQVMGILKELPVAKKNFFQGTKVENCLC